MPATQEAAMIHLHRKAPWNTSLRDWRTRYIQVGNRKFTAELDGGIWSVWEVGDDGLPLGWREHGVRDEMSVALAFNQQQVRLAIDLRLGGKNEDEIRKAVHAAPRLGTGRNHPKNVEARRNWRTR